MNLELEAQGLADPSLPRGGPTQLRALVARIKKHPRELYWRHRLVQSIDPMAPAPPRLRPLLLDSARKLIIADPDWFVAVGLPSRVVDQWTQAEATTLLRGFKCRPIERQHWALARFWFGAAFRSVDLKAFLVRARTELEAIPSAKRSEDHAEFLGEVLLRIDDGSFAQQLKTLTSGLPMSSPVIASRLLAWMAHCAKDAPSFEYLAEIFRSLPVQLRGGRDRIAYDNLEGMRELAAGELGSVEARLKGMIELAPQADFLGNPDTMQLVRALAEKKALPSLVRQYVEAALQSDWREWVRPELEKFLLEI